MLLVGILLGVLALLAVPVDVAFQLQGVAGFKGQLAFRWLFGLVRVRAAVPRARTSSAGHAAGPAARPSRVRTRREGVRPGRVLEVLRQAAFRRRAHRFLGDLVRAAHVRRLHLAMRLGLGDPADTGCLWAVLGPLSAAAQGLRGTEVRIEPEFVDPVLELQAHGRLRVVPLQLLALVSGFALSPASIRAWRTLRRDHA